ncbi:hypothetical protein DSM104329_04892 [Capillimicrobium parvum]|uniref:Uncharacterized protein n=1 Tax=Capillimicrobium parvum TaxID=2884022 RepID=A0A9E6Y257_9ACTN|nr:hypothetical protein DSM104329_04892 [Capillimicrobium parvum]
MAFTQSVRAGPGASCRLDESGPSVAVMDFLAIAIGVVVFVVLYLSIEAFDRV